MTGDKRRLSSEQFERFLLDLVMVVFNDFDEIVGPGRAGGGRVDFLVQDPDLRQIVLIEAKSWTPRQSSYLNAMKAQLRAAADELANPAGMAVRQILAFPGSLPEPLVDRAQQVMADEYEIWDGPRLWELLRTAPHVADDHPEVVEVLRDATTSQSEKGPKAEELSLRLQQIPCGRESWRQYQRLVRDVLELGFCPPLEIPKWESRNEPDTNRRDLVFPNYASEGFWAFLRNQYCAEYVVVDAKNYCAEVGKDQVLQMANYLNEYSVGLFGLIISRQGASTTAEQVQREQWLLYRKLILLLDDGGLLQILEAWASDQNPSDVIKQAVEIFRLSI